jgi:acid phosphatase type 7
VKPLWDVLYAAGADVVLSGNEHNYERFAPQDPDGRADPKRGIREFVVGTGGYSHYPIVNPIPNGKVHNDDTYGVLKLTLHPKGYEWRFVPVEGRTFSDSGSAQCH